MKYSRKVAARQVYNALLVAIALSGSYVLLVRLYVQRRPPWMAWLGVIAVAAFVFVMWRRPARPQGDTNSRMES